MKKTVCTVLCVIALLTAFFGGSLHGFEKIALSAPVYDRIQNELNIYDSAGLKSDATTRINRLLVSYLRGETDDLSIEEEIFGMKQQVFNEDEKLHMVDVANLFRLERTLKIALIILAVVSAATVLMISGRDSAMLLTRSFKWFFIVLGVILLTAVVLFFTVGFDRLFILFHQLLFTNDLWLMDPATDVMIRLFPSEFFQSIAFDAGMIALVQGTYAVGILFMCNVFFLLATLRRKQTS